MTGHRSEALTVESILAVRDQTRQPAEPVEFPLIVTGRHARVLLGMPGRLINKARMEPQRWRGGLWMVIGT